MSKPFGTYPLGAFLARVLPALALALGLWLGLREVGRIGANFVREQYIIFQSERARALGNSQIEVIPLTQKKVEPTTR